jgi:hypothetical protein
MELESPNRYDGIMKTTIDIPKDELDELVRETKAKTKKEAVVRAVKEFNRKRRLDRVSRMLGTFKDFMTADELQRLRKEK